MLDLTKLDEIPLVDLDAKIRAHLLEKQFEAKKVTTGFLAGNDIVIGAITDYEPSDIEQWVVSLVKSGFRGKKIALVYNAKQPVIDALQKHGFVIWALARASEEKKKEGWVYYYKDRSAFNVCLERFWHAWVFLNRAEFQHEGHIFMTDVKDVVFQRNPSDFFAARHDDDGYEIFVASEGLLYKDEPWGANNVQQSFGKTVWASVENAEIFNAGTIAGKNGKAFREFLQAIYFYARGAKTTNGYVQGGGGADQAAMNILLNQTAWQNITRFFTTGDGWALNAGTTNDPTKRELFEGKMLGLPAFFATVDPANPDAFVLVPGVKTIDNRLFHIVHQYDRVPEWKAYFEKEFRYS